jgi:(1->4)-alpha-D-glucan 1-alpha-D-glucosylmutase
MLGQCVDGADDALGERVRRFARRFQQFTAPVTAKGVEDTAFYRYSRLASLNEVGGDPSRFGASIKAFHHDGANRAARWPHSMLATSTHDHKRSADVRCRIDVLSEMPAAWRLLLRRWSRMNRSGAAGQSPLAPADEYLLYQTLLGTWPVGGLDDDALGPYRERIQQYMRKAAREAKTRTSWVRPDEDYEAALHAFIAGLLVRRSPNPFIDDLTTQSARLARFGAFNTISTTLIKFTSPGVPDIYQGHETINLTLVDPDNRRPVDYPALERMLDTFEAQGEEAAAATIASPEDGRAKLWVTWRLLALRRQEPALFDDGDYRGLEITGARAGNVVAYARQHRGVTLVVIVGRLFSQLTGDTDGLPLGDAVWGDTAVALPGVLDLPDGTVLTSALTGEALTVQAGRIAVAAAFARFAGAVLIART